MGDSPLAKKLQAELGVPTTQVNTNTTPATEVPLAPTTVTPELNPVVSGTVGVGGMQTSQAWTATTRSDVVSDTRIEADKTIADTAKAEADSQKKITEELSKIDKAQLDTVTSDTQKNQAEFEKIQNEQILEKSKNEIDYQNELRKYTDEEVSSIKRQQESENQANAAAAAELKAKSDAAEYEMKTQNEIATQQANIAFAKLWLSFSWAAINTATNIYTQWVYNLAKLKTTNARNYADLQVKINTIAFDHTRQVNNIIQEATEKEFTSKERLREFIEKAQTNILNSKESAQKTIQSAIDSYKKERQAREDKLYSDMNAANARLQSATSDIQKTVEANESTAKKKIELLIANGQWGSLSPAQRVELEQRAWVPAGTTANTIVAKTTQMLMDNLKTVVGKNVSVPPAILAKMHTEVQRALNLNIPLATATQIAIDKYKNSIPQVKQMEDAALAKAALDAAKTKADIDVKESTVNKNNATATKALRAPSGGSGWGTKQKRYAWVTVSWEALIDKGWVPYTLDWKVYTWQVFSLMWTEQWGDLFNPTLESRYLKTPAQNSTPPVQMPKLSTKWFVSALWSLLMK